MKRLLLLVLLLSATAFAFAQPATDTIVVVPIKTLMPQAAKKVGTLKAGNNATKTHCNYEQVIAEAKQEAAAMGGNVVKITELIAPAFVSKCYRIAADVYYAPAFRDSVLADLHTSQNLQTASRPHATLFVYRLKDTIAFATSYYLHMDNDSVIAKVSSGGAKAVDIYQEGQVTLWAKTETRKELKLDVRQGGAYYIRCGLVKGSLRNLPVLELVDKQVGSEQYNRLKSGKKNMDVQYLRLAH